MLLLVPIVLLLSFYASTIYGYIYLCFTTFPRIFKMQYGFSNSTASLAYLGIGVGAVLGLFLCGAVSDRLVASLTKKNGGEPRPEYRLPILIFGAVEVSIGLFLYAWSAAYKLHWIIPIIGTLLLGSGMVIAFVSGHDASAI